MFEVLFYGIISFVITGVDDLLILMSLYLRYPKMYKQVILGTLIGLIIVMIPSYIFAEIVNNFNISNYIKIEVIIGIVFLYIAYGLLKDIFSKEDDNNDEKILESEIEKNKNKKLKVVFLAGVTYFLNGLDDFLIYSSFYLKYDYLSQSIIFSIGILLGLVFFVMITSFLGKKIMPLEEKKQNFIKTIIVIILIISSIVLIIGILKRLIKISLFLF